MIFGFARLRIFENVEPDETIELKLNLRASLMGNNDIKFLVRYEVATNSKEEVSKMSRYRFTRVSF